ncbi:hypothetical protein CIK87_10775 [Prevotella sp. P5-64]|nr:hypothetical protein CIK87_10775 [Prevotella sp. P5-64]
MEKCYKNNNRIANNNLSLEIFILRVLILSGTSWNTHIFSCEDSDSWSIRKPHIPDNRFLDEPSVTHKGMLSAIPMVAQIINNSFMSDNTSNKDVINLDYFS